MSETPESPPPAGPSSPRIALKKQAKREAILAAALAEFSERGFANARLSAVAERAGVAKGTLYLYFAGKEDLFAGVVRESLPFVERDLPAAEDARSPRAALRDFLLRAADDLQRSGRGAIALVALTEGRNFPQLVDVYVEAVLEPLLIRIARLTGEDASPALDPVRRFPQLLLAPVLSGLLWNNFMTGRPELDLVELLDAQLTLILGRD